MLAFALVLSCAANLLRIRTESREGLFQALPVELRGQQHQPPGISPVVQQDPQPWVAHCSDPGIGRTVPVGAFGSARGTPTAPGTLRGIPSAKSPQHGTLGQSRALQAV